MTVRRAEGHGFFLCLLINLVFRFEYLILAGILIALHFILSFPMWPVYVCLGLWLVHALIITIVFSMANRIGNEPSPERENKNPYSKKNSDILK